MDVIIATSAKTDEEALALLKKVLIFHLETKKEVKMAKVSLVQRDLKRRKLWNKYKEKEQIFWQ